MTRLTITTFREARNVMTMDEVARRIWAAFGLGITAGVGIAIAAVYALRLFGVL